MNTIKWTSLATTCTILGRCRWLGWGGGGGLIVKLFDFSLVALRFVLLERAPVASARQKYCFES